MAYKTTQHKGTVEAAVADALSELQSLRDEVREIVDNASEGLAETQRIQTLSDTADTLDNHVDDEPDCPECLKAVECTWNESHNARKRRGDSRSTRHENAVQMLAAAKDAADKWLEEAEAQKAQGAGMDEDELQAAQDYIDAAQELVDGLDGACEYPGMYG